VLDPPSGWDINGPLLATGHYQVSHTVLQLVMMMDDALAYACHQGQCRWSTGCVAWKCELPAGHGWLAMIAGCCLRHAAACSHNGAA